MVAVIMEDFTADTIMAVIGEAGAAEAIGIILVITLGTTILTATPILTATLILTTAAIIIIPIITMVPHITITTHILVGYILVIKSSFHKQGGVELGDIKEFMGNLTTIWWQN